MKTKQLTFLLSLTFLFLFSGSSVAFFDSYNDGLDAYEKGDYKTAHRIFLKLAKKGLAEAQHNLGVMHAKGRGVPQDHKEALKWYRLVAEQGDAEAQRSLGVMSLSAYPLMVFLVSKVSKRDLEEEQRIRDEKRKERKAKGGGPPIMNRDGF